MALLYQEIMNVPGLSGSWQDRLRSYGQRFYGSGYTGSYDQNMDLYNRIKSGDYGTATPVTPATTTSTVANTIPTPTAVTPFSEVLPYEKLFNQNLITGLAESQINPEYERERYRQLQSLNSELAGTGMYRSGRGVQATQNLEDSLQRQRQEQVQSFGSNISNYLTDYYNQLSQQYYKNPSQYVAPTLQTMEDYLNLNPALAQAYNTQTNIANTYTNPFTY